MIVDLHSHTGFSRCGADEPESLVLEMIKKGVDVLGISDHNYGMTDVGYKKVFDVYTALRDKYKDKIKIYRGIEIATVKGYELQKAEELPSFDYCLIEHLGDPDSIMKGDIVGYAETIKIKNKGIAHTDLFGFARNNGLNEKEFIERVANAGLFWEMNVNYDGIHGYREHEYVKTFMKDEREQRIAKDAGLKISVGFDGHRLNEYRVDRVVCMNEWLNSNGFNLVTGFDNL